MSLVERIEADHAAARVAAQQGGDNVRALLLGTILGELRNDARKVENRAPTEAEANAKVVAYIVTARQNIARVAASRPELVPGFEAEVAILSPYVPDMPEVPDDDAIRGAIAEIRAAQPGANIGAVMSALRQRYGAALDGKRAAEIAKAA